MTAATLFSRMDRATQLAIRTTTHGLFGEPIISNKRKHRQARRRANAVLREMSLTEYVAWLNSGSDGSCGLTDDVDHWAECNVHTALDLARYLDACVDREREKDYGYYQEGEAA